MQYMLTLSLESYDIRTLSLKLLSLNMAQQQFNQIQHNYHRQPMKLSKAEDRKRRYKFHLNDHIDILIEILKRVDGRSLSVAACVCRLWCTIARSDSLWENLCFRQVSPPPSGVRPVVVALGGYRRLYMVCVRPVLSRLGELRVGESGRTNRRVWSREEVQLSLSLFCVDYYERLGVGERFGNASPSSLMFL